VVVAVDHQRGGRELACENARHRRGEWFDPAVADAFLDCAPELLASIEAESVWEGVLDAEPQPQARIPATRVESVAAAFGDFADLKSPFTLGHSAGVAALVETAAQTLRLSDEEAFALRASGFLHDLGRVSVSNPIWDKPGPLSAAEWERVRLPRLLQRARPLAVTEPRSTRADRRHAPRTARRQRLPPRRHGNDARHARQAARRSRRLPGPH
jgi:hypothetical protein